MRCGRNRPLNSVPPACHYPAAMITRLKSSFVALLVIALLAVDMFPGNGWEAVRRSVTTDGDSDTIGAVTGALVGASGDAFLRSWPTLRHRFEPRYVRWIEWEADDFPFVGPARPSWLKRLLEAFKRAS